MNEKVSIIMSVYKEEKEELQMAIDSILKQTYSNFEFIIIIDNPNDNWREEYIKSLNDSRIKILKNEKNIGLPFSLNRGIDIASGIYIARMDADDISEKSRIEKQIEFLNKNNLDLCGTNFYYFYNGKDLEEANMPENNAQIKKMLKFQNCIAHPTWLGKREVFIKNKGYRNIHTCEDLDFLLRGQLLGVKMGNVQEYLLKYRFNTKGISRTNAGKQIVITEYLCKNYRNEKIISEKEVSKYINTKKFNQKAKRYDEYTRVKNSIKNDKNIRNIVQMFLYVDILFFSLKNKIVERLIISGGKNVGK